MSLPRFFFATVVALLIAGGSFEARLAARYRRELAAQPATVAQLERQIQAAHSDKVETLELARAKLSAPAPESVEALDNSEVVDAAEVGRWLSKVKQFKQAFVAHPADNIPQLALLTDKEWVAIARGAQLDTAAGLDRAFAKARVAAKSRYSSFLHAALKSYLETNHDNLPATLDELLPCFEQLPNQPGNADAAAAADPAMLAQYELTVSGKFGEAPDGVIVREKNVANEKLDNRIELLRSDGALTFRNSFPPPTLDAAVEIERGVRAFALANPNASPRTAAELLPFIDGPFGLVLAESLIQHPQTSEDLKTFQSEVTKLLIKPNSL